MNYEKRMYRRIFTDTAPGQQTVSFELLTVVHRVKLTPQEAALLNRGKLENHSDVFFELLIAEGEPDPQPVTITDAKSGPSSPVDHKGRLLSSDGGSRRVPVTGGGNDHRPRGRSGF